jgi:hypothetical protein
MSSNSEMYLNNPSFNLNEALRLTKNGLVNPSDKVYFEYVEQARTPSSSITMAILLLVLGISLVLGFFVYLIMNTRYVSKRLKRLSIPNLIKKNNKNVDIDGDYLINGLYL